jgi:hypothetical protein
VPGGLVDVAAVDVAAMAVLPEYQISQGPEGSALTSTMINAHTSLGRYRTDGARIRSTKQ